MEWANISEEKKDDVSEEVEAVSMLIFVKTPNGKTIPFNVNKRDTIKDVKTKVEAKEGIPLREQRMAFAGEQLENYRTLADNNIQTNQTLAVSLRISGGGRKVAQGKEKKVETYRSRFSTSS